MQFDDTRDGAFGLTSLAARAYSTEAPIPFPDPLPEIGAQGCSLAPHSRLLSSDGYHKNTLNQCMSCHVCLCTSLTCIWAYALES